MRNHRVVITGMGIVSSLGNDVNEWWENIISGKSAVGYTDRFEEYNIKPKPKAAEIKDFSFRDYFDEYEKYEIYLDRGMQFGLVAAKQAYDNSGIVKERKYSIDEKFGIYVGSTTGGISSAFEAGVNFIRQKEYTGRKELLYRFPPASWGAILANYFKASGIIRTVGTSCYAGGESIGNCYRDIKNGETEYALAGGMDAPIVLTNYLSFNNIGAVSKWEGDPKEACSPFSKDRTGMVFGEGAAFFLVESLESARKRKAKIYAEIIGYAATSDGDNMVHPSERGHRWADAIKDVLKEANVKKTEISYISCHGTGTKLNDSAEIRAIQEALGEESNVKVGSIKSMIGHAFGGASAIELVQILKTFETNIIPPTINYREEDPNCSLDCVPNKKEEKYHCKYILKTATGFGGSNMAMLLKRWEE